MSVVPYTGVRSQRRRTLDRAQVVEAALALLDEAGLDGLTMRSLAERLGVRATALYRHVRDKDELLVLLGDALAGAIEPVGLDPPWQARLRELAWRVRRGLLAHRDAARLLAATMPSGPRRLAHVEALLALLTAAGFTPEEAARAAYHFNNLVTEFVADEVRLRLAAEAAGVSPEALLAEARRGLAALPADQFPHLTRHAAGGADADRDASFRFGVDVWIKGMERILAAHADRSAD
jgi:TetR/AcrR family tetracycline transcriptional repressor